MIDADLTQLISTREVIGGGGESGVLPDGTPVTSAYRAKEALRLRLTGKSFSQIAYALGYSNPKSAYNAYKAALDWTNVNQDLEELVQTEVMRLDDWMSKLIKRGLDARAVEVLVKVSERKAKLLGLDAPEKKMIKGTFDINSRTMEVTPDFVAETIRELSRSNRSALAAHSGESVDPAQADSETSSLPTSNPA